MDIKKLFLPLMIASFALSGCQTVPTSSQATGSQQSDSQSEVTDDINLSFKGITIKNAYEDADYTFDGCLTDIIIGAWLIAGDECEMIIKPKQDITPKITFKVSDPSVLQTYEKVEEGVTSYFIKGLKTGGAVFEIFADGDLIFRQAVNTRIPVRDLDTMLNAVSKADYWTGVFTKVSGAGDYRLMFEQGQDGYYNSCSLSMLEVDVDYGTAEFDINIDSKKEVYMSPLHVFEFTLNVTKPTQEITPIKMWISLALDMIYVFEKAAIIDFFIPVYVE